MLDYSIINDNIKIEVTDLYNKFLESDNDISLINQISKLIDTQYDAKLQELQQNIKIEHGSLAEEYPEQLMSYIFLYLDSKVLEIGGNIGRNSMIIASKVSNENYVVLETNKTDA